MTARYDDDRLLSAWLHDVAPAREPEHLLGQVLARTARTRRRPAWRNPERWNPMSAITSRLAPAAPFPWRLLAVAALVLALATGLLLAASGAFRSKAPPFGPAANGQLFYSVEGDLYRRDATGEAVAVLTGDAQDFAPVISPDGSKVAFLRSAAGEATGLWVMSPEGEGLRKLDTPEGDPGWFEWAPQGDVAAYLTDRNGLRGKLYLVPANGSAATSIDTGIVLEQAWWRPASGSQLALLGTSPDGTRGIWLINRDGTGLQRLDLDRGFQDDPFYRGAEFAYFWTFAWSPTGDRLLYTQLEPVPEAPDANGFRVHVATVASDGAVSDDRIIELAASSDDELAPAWLPTGDGIVVQSVEGGRQWLSSASLGDTSVGAVRDLGIEASDYIGVQVAPDGQSLLAILPAASGGKPTIDLVDLRSLSVTHMDVGDDVAWQRRAP